MHATKGKFVFVARNKKGKFVFVARNKEKRRFLLLLRATKAEKGAFTFPNDTMGAIAMTEAEPSAFTTHVLRHLRAVADADAEAGEAGEAGEAPLVPPAMRVLRLRCGGEVYGVHAFVAAYHSAYLRASATTHVRVTSPSTFDVEGDPAALGRAVECMYSNRAAGLSFPSVADAVATLRTASFLQFRALERACAGWIENWVDACADGETTRVACDADVLLCADLWALLDAEALAPPCHSLARTVRLVLVDMLAQRHVSDPVVVAALRRLTLDALASLTGRADDCDDDDGDEAACPVLAIELALAFSAGGREPEGLKVLGHIDLDVLPAAYLRTLATSGRLGLGDKRAFLRAAQGRGRAVDGLGGLGALGSWTGRFGSCAGSVALAAQSLTLVVTPLVGYPIDMDGCGVQHTSMCVDVGGQVFTFKALAPEEPVPHVYAGVRAPTGYTLCGRKWRAFGVVPRFMHDGTFAAAAHGTRIYFVAMTTHHCARLDVATGLWTVLPPLRTPREWPCIAVLGPFLYVLGGAREGLGGLGPASAAAELAPLPTERMRLTDPDDDCSWQLARADGAAPFARIATYRCAAVAAADGSSICVLGGCFREPQRPSLVLSSDAVTRIDGDGDGHAMPRMLGHRHGLGAFATASGHVVALGGRHGSACGRTPLAECFDPCTQTWRALEVRGGRPSAEVVRASGGLE